MSEEKKDNLVHLTIDDIPVAVPPGTLIWKAAQEAGIEIPIYCYHPKMPPLGACRMCFVEVEKMPKPPQTACTTPVAEGMVVHTKTEKVLKARRGTLEFLLINHPLDCPICDKAGECDLQDFTLRHGPGNTRFTLNKRHYQKPIPMSKDINLDRERCILCQRCTRFSSEISMDNGLVMINRGFRMEVGTAPGKPFDSIFSGNTVEICPVGALTATSYRFKARPWELKHTASICNQCSVGCNVDINTRVDRVMRQMIRTNDEVDDGWLCNRGRWDVGFVNDPQRLRTPLIRRNGTLTPATWDEAINHVATQLKSVVNKHGAKAVAGIGSTRTTNEETYLFQKLLRDVLGTANIDHYHGVFPGARDQLTGKAWMMSNSIADLEKASHIVLIASDPYKNTPVVNLRIKKAFKNGAKIYIVHPNQTDLDRFAVQKVTIPEQSAGSAVKVMLKHALQNNAVAGYDEIRSRVQREEQLIRAAVDSFGAKVTTQLQQLADEIVAAPNAVILYDEVSTLEPQNEQLAQDVQALTVLTQSAGGPLFTNANSLGARDMGLLPDALPGYVNAKEVGLSYNEILSDGQVKALFVMGANPARHINGQLSSSLEFVVVQDIRLSETAQLADVVLPAVTYAEKDGTLTNVDHHVQRIRRALRPLPGAKADWEILTLLAQALGASWSYSEPSEIFSEIATENPFYAGLDWDDLGLQGVRTQEQEVAHA